MNGGDGSVRCLILRNPKGISGLLHLTGPSPFLLQEGVIMDQFSLQDEVLIPSGIDGIICGEWMDTDEKRKYCARYFDKSGNRQEEWFLPHELKKRV